MPGSPYLDERPNGLLTWPVLLPIVTVIFIVECVAGHWIWFNYPEWKEWVYVILGIDLATLIAIYLYSMYNEKNSTESQNSLE
ncbi:MAG: hypothetical protein VYB50_04230 [Candidatus Thermoplasmatota archaeon]|nr:hypothetical protein [Candidatus Thermoplasmatota archaeon]